VSESPDDLLVDPSPQGQNGPERPSEPPGNWLGPDESADTSGLPQALLEASQREWDKEDAAPPEPPPEPDPALAPPREFDARWREAFSGLNYLGHLDDEFTLWGHRFRIVTPSQGERMEIGRLHQPYAGTLASEMAFEAIFVAAYLQQIDGEDLAQPIMVDTAKDTSLRDRHNWVKENLRRPVVAKVYAKCLALEEEVDKVLDAMGEA
jgi:hypothetical protein